MRGNLNLKERTSWIIDDVIKKRRLSNEKLAQIIGCNKSTVNNYRRKISSPNGDFIESFCKKFNVKTEWFVTGEGDPYQEESRKPSVNMNTAGYIDYSLMDRFYAVIDEFTTETNIPLKGGLKSILVSKLYNEFAEPVTKKSLNDLMIALKILPSTFIVKSKSDMVITRDVIKITQYIESIIKSGKKANCLITGEYGMGKTVISRYISDIMIKNNIFYKSISSSDLGLSKYGMRISDIYNMIILNSFNNNERKLSKRIEDRESQAKETLQQLEPSPFYLIVRAAQDIPISILKELIHFQQSNDITNFSIILIALPTIPPMPNCEYINLQGLSENEIKQYLKILSKKSQGKLPLKVPIEMFQGVTSYHDVLNRYLYSIWEMQIENS
ncbi:MAG: helix-turn-helix domain-containing protein [Desulfobacteraceae bacterium]|nr:MAG: helix-turn-helix domain-containing protein [Desulfobacteraceae bacterium]